MSIEKQIADMMQEKLTDGTLEKVIEEKLTKCIGECMDNMFKWNGPGKELLEKKLQEVMVPAIERHNFSNYTLKLDTILTEIVENTALQENKDILENFKEIMTADKKKEIALSDIYNAWKDWAEDEVSTVGLDVTYDGEPMYECVEVKMTVEDVESCYKSSPECKVVRFTCEHDEDINFQFELYKYTWMDGWEISNTDGQNLRSLAFADKIQMLTMRLSRDRTKILVDVEYDTDEIQPSKEPEASWS